MVETAVIIDPVDIECLIKVFHFWEEDCNWELKENIKLIEASEKFRLLIPREKDLRMITIEESRDYQNENPSKKIDSPEQLIHYSPSGEDVKKWAESGDKRVKKVGYSEKIRIPRLPLKSEVIKEKTEKNPFTQYKKNNKKYLAVTTWEQVQEAANLDVVKGSKGKIRIVWEGPKKLSSETSKMKNP